jgi:hypothetical protein
LCSLILKMNYKATGSFFFLINSIGSLLMFYLL